MTRYPAHLQELVDSYLEQVRFSTEVPIAGLEEAMRYSLLAGGKRIRPVLALATAQALGREPDSVLPYAAALEMIHTYSLIHDDLPAMDDDDLRRGQPTCHKTFGENVAILAGDGLYAEAFAHVLSSQEAPAQQLIAAVRGLALATGVGGMVGGQYLDVMATAPAGSVGLRHLHALKTGRLICASVTGVLALSGASDSATMDFANFAAEAGVMFQIVDDILDVTGTDAALGKPSGSDQRHGKRTYVSEFGLQQAQVLAAETYDRARTYLATAAPRGAPELEQITNFIYTRTS